MARSDPAPIDRELVEELCGGRIYERGLSYFRSGMVINPIVDGDTLIGEVKGSRPRPYNVTIEFTEDEIIPYCDCPHEVLFCKHVCALLLAWSETPQSFTRVEGAVDFQSGKEAVVARYVDQYDPEDLEVDEEPTPVEPTGAFDRAKAKREFVDLLYARTVQELKGMLRQLSLSIGNRTKEDYVEYLANLFTEPEQIRNRILSLGGEERLILDVIHLAGGAQGLTIERLQQRLKSFGRLAAATRAGTVLEDLSTQGLIVRAGYNRWDGYNAVRVPDAVSAELYAHSISHLLSPRRYNEETLEIVSRPKPVDEALHTVWSYFVERAIVPRPLPERRLFEQQRNGLQGWNNSPDEIAELERQPRLMNAPFFSLTVLPPSLPLQDVDLRTLAGRIAGGENEVLFLYHLLKNLPALKEKERISVHEDKMQEFLRLPRSRRLEELVRVWLKMDRWCEFSLFSSIAGKARVRRLVGTAYLKRREFLRTLAEGQRFVANVISRLEGNKWYSVSTFLDVLQALHPDFLVRPLATLAGQRLWWFQSAATGNDLDPFSRDGWRAAEGQYVIGVLQGPLLWLGMVELAYLDGKLEAFRKTPLASLLSGRAPSQGKGEETRIEVGPDLSMAVSSGVADSKVHNFLEKLGVLVEATPTRFRYRLTPDRVGRAFDDGLRVADIAGFLHSYGAPVSPEVAQALEKWWAGFGLVRLYDNLTVVELADDYALKELRASTSIDQHIIFEFSPRLVVVSPESVDSLVAEITRKGYTPKVVEGEL